MSLSRRYAVTAAVLVTLAPVPTVAQTAGRLPRVLELPSSTRALALGGAYQMGAPQSEAVFFHPSLLSRARGVALELQRWGASSNSVAASMVLGSTGTGFAIGLQTLQFGGPSLGSAAAPLGQDHLFNHGPVPVSERVLSLGWGFAAGTVFDFGVVGRLADERVGLARQSVISIDVGLGRRIGPVVFGFTVKNFGEKPLSEEDRAPTGWMAGLGSYGYEVGTLDLGAAASLERTPDGRLTGSGGIEVAYWPVVGRTFIARVGLREVEDGSDMSALSFGLASWWDDLIVEWAYRPWGGDVSGTHRLGVGWRRAGGSIE